MPAQIIYADFRSKTYHKPETLEQMAIGILEQFTETESFTDSAPCEMNPGCTRRRTKTRLDVFSPSFFDKYEDWLNLAVHDINEINRMGLIDKVREAIGGKKATVNYGPNGQLYLNTPEKSIWVRPTDSAEDIKARLDNPFEGNYMSITGLKSGAFRAMMEEMKAEIGVIQERGVAEVKAATVEASNEIKTTVANVKSKLKSEVADALQEFAEYTNGGPFIERRPAMTAIVEEHEAIRRRLEEIRAELNLALTGSAVPTEALKADQPYSYEDLYG